MRTKYDKSADAIYIYIDESRSKVHQTQGEWPYHIDLDVNGDVIGIEVMDASTIFNKDFLSKAS